MVQPLDEPLVHKLVKEIHLLRRVLQHIADHMLEHCLRDYHVVRQVRKRHLRLNHPELRRMSGRIGIFRPESRTECIYVLKRKGICLHV